jgi:S1-C subfamily serine protease
LAVWKRIQPSFVTLMRGGLPGGTAALIDPSGLFLAHQSSLSGSAVLGTLSSGRVIRLISVGYDQLTHSALLQAQDWRQDFGIPVRVPEGDEVGHGVVFAVLPTGPIRAAFTSLNRPGFFQAERRIMPLNEVHFETADDGCAGALLVDEDGELLGVLGATLAKPVPEGFDGVTSNVQNLNSGPGLRGGFGGSASRGGGGRGIPNGPTPLDRVLKNQQQRMGPSSMTVAYTVGIVVMKRVIDGFKTPDHHVGYPSIGLYCKNTPGGGAYVQAVQPDSPADRSHIQSGDVLTQIGSDPVRDQVDFALVMLKQNPGDKILVQFKRRNRTYVQEVVVGHS